MTIRWQDDGDGYWSAWAEDAAWNGEDLEVGSVSRNLRPLPEPSGWKARYWGRAESSRYWTGAGADPAVVGTWPTRELAMAELEKRWGG